MSRDEVLEALLRSKEPSVRWKVRVLALEEDPTSRRIRALEEQVRRSPRVRALLTRRDSRGRSTASRHPYAKWQGAHWVLAALADLGYPEADCSLAPMRDQVLDTWLSPRYYREFDAATKAGTYRGTGVPRVRGRFRRCASQQGNALYSLTRLGLADERTEDLVERLLHWQWPDGGWNCDRRPAADTSSFWESRHPMLGLALHADRTGATAAREASRRAAEVFLSRRLFLERRSGKVMNPDFLELHYPLYYYYDILGGLKAMAEVGRIGDSRCRTALDVLEEKELPRGGWAAGRRLYKVSSKVETRSEPVDWGVAGKGVRNEWVTADAICVLAAAGRL